MQTSPWRHAHVPPQPFSPHVVPSHVGTHAPGRGGPPYPRRAARASAGHAAAVAAATPPSPSMPRSTCRRLRPLASDFTNASNRRSSMTFPIYETLAAMSSGRLVAGRIMREQRECEQPAIASSITSCWPRNMRVTPRSASEQRWSCHHRRATELPLQPEAPSTPRIPGASPSRL